ncbi:MAG TPA: ATP-dependent DNA ligase [Pseudonocardiaceae bacterium]
MLFADVVAVSGEVAATRSRTAKTEALAGVLGRLSADEIAPVVGFLAGAVRQGRIGVGWAGVFKLSVPPAAEPSLTVLDVDAALAELAVTSGAGSAARRTALLTELMGAATGDEQDFLRRLLTGELRQGALEAALADGVAAATGLPGAVVRRALMLSGDLGATAVAALTGGEQALAAFRLEVLRPVRPMLASPAESLEAAVTGLGECTVEHKLDGARIQVHRRGDDVLVVTRTLNDITARVPELVALVRELPCESVVLDGETLALTDDGRPRPFQETMSRFGAQSERELLLHPYFFDCLHLDGADLIDAPLAERLEALSRVAGPYRIPGVLTSEVHEAAAVLDAALAAGHEGVMVKALSSAYAAGRRGKAWQKVKPVHTLDLVVIGVEWGHGRRRGRLSNLHLGARDPDGGPPVMVGKTFKGLTDELLRWQTEEFLAREVSRDSYTVYVRPEVVVEIELDGVQVSTRYPGGVALRFARVLRYRPDKPANEADTIDAVRALLP